jgi:acylphosphatase
MTEKQVYVKVYGIVQGVSFRYFTRHVGNSLGITGFVRNLPDGGVEAVLEGEEHRIRQMIDLLREGPESAVVENIEVEWGNYTGQFHGFTIRF